MRAAAILIVALQLSGCVGLAEAIAERHESACRAYGFDRTRDPDAFAACYQRESAAYWRKVARDIP